MRETALFSRVTRPAVHRGLRAASYGDWFTWSHATKKFISRNRAILSTPRRVQLVDLPGGGLYPSTYSLPFTQDMDAEFRSDVAGFARWLLDTANGSRALWLTGLLGDGVTPWILRHLLTLVRTAMAEQLRGDVRAMLSPVAAAEANSEFPLHADLYPGTRLLLIYDDVPTDGSGAARLLPVHELTKATRACPAMPATTRQRIRRLLADSCRAQSYDTLFGLLHTEWRPWYRELQSEFAERSFSVAFRRGEGYILNDRRWLHGRDAPTTSVGARRFHRLVFG